MFDTISTLLDHFVHDKRNHWSNEVNAQGKQNERTAYPKDKLKFTFIFSSPEFINWPLKKTVITKTHKKNFSKSNPSITGVWNFFLILEQKQRNEKTKENIPNKLYYVQISSWTSLIQASKERSQEHVQCGCIKDVPVIFKSNFKDCLVSTNTSSEM